MKNAALIVLFALAGCLTPTKYNAQYDAKFCEEWTACNPDEECELPETDYSSCSFNKEAARSCLDGEWICDNSNTAFPTLGIPAVCADVYQNCVLDTGPTGTAGGASTGTPTGTGGTQ